MTSFGDQKLNSTSFVQQTMDYITDAIKRRQLLPGSKIPTEAQLTEILGVSRNTVREAIKILVYMGVLEIRRPEGTFVRSGFSESLIDPMIYGIILNQGDSIQDLMDLREMMESGAIRLVIRNASDEEIEQLREPLETLKNACLAGEPDLETVFQADDAFHIAVNALGGNEMVIRICNTVRALTHSMRHESVEEMLREHRGEELYLAHERIFLILKERNLRSLEQKVRSTYFVKGVALDSFPDDDDG